jgi:SOS-response transcriptional repressor LexA
MLRVSGDSMIDAGVVDGDHIVVRHLPRTWVGLIEGVGQT